MLLEGQIYFSNNILPSKDLEKVTLVQTHLKLRHGVPVSDLTNIVYPGSKRNLLNFSWVRCKRCAVSAIGLDKKTIGHQEFSHSGGGLEYFMIYCR